MSKRLYYEDSYISEFDGKVTSLHEKDDLTYIALDQTGFFPEGGGQTSDIGALNDMQVQDVQIIDDEIYHIVKSIEVYEVHVGDTLHGIIDTKKRFSDMQQHTAEHILSGIAHSLYGFENCGFHLGSSVVYMDFDHVITQEQIQKIEDIANQVVWSNVAIKCYFPTKDEEKNINYRSKMQIDEDLRLVEIEGVDICACCAPHVSSTGEVGVIKILTSEKHRGGSRLTMLAGERALEDVNIKLTQNHKISTMLSAKDSETSIAVENLMFENKKLKNEVYNINREVISFKIDEIGYSRRIVIFDSSLSGNLLRDFATGIISKADEFIAVFAYVDTCFKYIIASHRFDVRKISEQLIEKFGGKGGGNPQMVQGSISADQEDIHDFLTNLKM